MKKYLYQYIKNIDELLKREKIDDTIIERHLIKISFFEEERKIHLWITILYAILTFISFSLSIFSWTFALVGIILICFLIPYVLHYFHLENGVQYLYKQYDELLRRANK